jgi:phage terminase large subunit GpA-like protein
MNWQEQIKTKQTERLAHRLDEAIAKALKPPPKLTVSEWADAYRVLSSEAAAEPGKWSTSRAEYQRGMMDAVSDPSIETIVLMTCAQVGKTELINNVVGYHIHQDPAPMLVVQPTLEMAQTWSKDRLSPCLRDTPVLAGKVKDPRSRDSGNTTLHKSFAGGHVTACGANSPSSLASRPCRIILCDEVDRYPLSAGTEGDPVSLAKKRSSTFWNRKIILVSTPTEKGASRIEQAYDESDQRKYFVQCPDCDEYQVLKWSQVKWEDQNPYSARYTCECCGTLWDDTARFRAIRYGEWRATSEAKGKIAGFHLNGLYSPWTPLYEAVSDFMSSKRDPMRLKTWVNTFLGETWEEQGDRIDEFDLIERCENWGKDLPEDVLLLTAGVDVQDNRLEVEIVGWGRGEESWSISYQTIYGDPSTSELWARLDTVLQEKFTHPTLGEMIVRGACVDSGGHYTQQVYNYARLRAGRRVFAIKGIGGEGKPVAGRPTKNNIGKINLFPRLGVDTAKEIVYARLKMKEEGDGYCHFPIGRDEEYFRMLTAEKKVTKYFKGRPRMEWQKIRTRNEALDCRVYATAALAILNANLQTLYQQAQNRVQSPEQAQPMRRPALPKRSSFVHGYK